MTNKPSYWEEAKNYLQKKDSTLSKVIAHYPQSYLQTNPNAFTVLCNTILGQQISITAANSIKTKLLGLIKSFSPQKIINCNETNLKSCGLSKQKIAYLYNIASFFENKKITKIYFQKQSLETIEKELIAIKGIGSWSVEMFLFFHLATPNIAPKKDIGYLNAIAKLYFKDTRPNEQQLEKLIQNWSPYNTVATWYLWRSIDEQPIKY